LNDKAWETRELMIQPTRFAEFNIVAVSEGQLHRIAKVVFQNRDGSILVMFPSFAHNEGLVGELSMKARARTASYGLANHGKVTGHLVKYSHHPDGRVHFSQDGRVRTEIKRQSVPLDRQHSHMFTIQVEGLKSFAPPRVNDKTPALVLNTEGNPKAMKILGRWYPLNRLSTFDATQPLPAVIPIAFPDGRQSMGWLVAPPLGSRYSQFGLFLVPEEMATLSTADDSCLIFLGGFDPSDIALDHSKETSFLVLKYPCSNPAELRASVGSIDFTPTRK
jgi:hypothetical protein